jgi:VIT1/CCC1 family predicted Fe2+/Mn2+ transporter
LPIVAMAVAPAPLRATAITVVSLIGLGALGALGGWIAGAPMFRAAVRVLVGGGLAMGVSTLVGHLIHLAGY